MVLSLRAPPGLLSPASPSHRSYFPWRHSLFSLASGRRGPVSLFLLVVFIYCMGILWKGSDYHAFEPVSPTLKKTITSGRGGKEKKESYVSSVKASVKEQKPVVDPVDVTPVVISPGTQSIVPVLAPSETPSSKFSDEMTSSSSWTTPEIPSNVDWSQYAFVQYATNMDYLCNSLMIFDELRKVGTKADLVLFYPDHYAPVDVENPWTKAEKLIVEARDVYGVKLHPIKVHHREAIDATWADSYTKLLAFNLTSYSRVLSLDSDGLVLQNMDELFFSPPAPVAAPLAYWLLPTQSVLSSQLLLITPSPTEFTRITDTIDTSSSSEYDMEIINKLYRDSAVILPHRPYDMLTAEFRRTGKEETWNYLGVIGERWDALGAFNEAKFMHFSDWPVPKPWTKPEKKVLAENAPRCVEVGDYGVDCLGRDLWVGLYRDFLINRSRVCKVQLPKWT